MITIYAVMIILSGKIEPLMYPEIFYTEEDCNAKKDEIKKSLIEEFVFTHPKLPHAICVKTEK